MWWFRTSQAVKIIMITMKITKRYHRVIDHHKLLSSYISQISCNSPPPFCPLSPRTQIFYSSSYVPIILPHLQFVKKRLFYKTAFWLELYHTVTLVKSGQARMSQPHHAVTLRHMRDATILTWAPGSGDYSVRYRR